MTDTPITPEILAEAKRLKCLRYGLFRIAERLDVNPLALCRALNFKRIPGLTETGDPDDSDGPQDASERGRIAKWCDDHLGDLHAAYPGGAPNLRSLLGEIRA